MAAAGLPTLADRGPPLCAGDLNECLAWDADHAGHSCGAEFLGRLQDSGLVNVTNRQWPADRATRQRPAYQVDRVLADTRTKGRVRMRNELPVPDGLSDPVPLWFAVMGLEA